MAWRPNENLMDGELSNRVPGKVTGWMRFFRKGKQPLKVKFDLEGDFHEDIRGADIELANSDPSDKNEALGGRDGTYMEGFATMQRGSVGDMTAGRPLGLWSPELSDRLKQELEIMWRESGISGEELEERRRSVASQYYANIAAGKLYYAYVDYPYLEWYSDNGRVVLELDPDQIRIIPPGTPPKDKTPEEFAQDRKKRTDAFGGFMRGMVESFRTGKNGKVTGIVIG